MFVKSFILGNEHELKIMFRRIVLAFIACRTFYITQNEKASEKRMNE